MQNEVIFILLFVVATAVALVLAGTGPGLLLSMTFGVVVISILVHGLTMSPLLRRLGVVSAAKERSNYEIALGRLQAAHAPREPRTGGPGSGGGRRQGRRSVKRRIDSLHWFLGCLTHQTGVSL